MSRECKLLTVGAQPRLLLCHLGGGLRLVTVVGGAERGDSVDVLRYQDGLDRETES